MIILRLSGERATFVNGRLASVLGERLPELEAGSLILDRRPQLQYIVIMPSKTIETRAHTTRDGRLNLTVDVDVADIDVEVVVTVTPVTAGPRIDENGWPVGFFERVAGSMPALRRGSQGDFEERLTLE